MSPWVQSCADLLECMPLELFLLPVHLRCAMVVDGPIFSSFVQVFPDVFAQASCLRCKEPNDRRQMCP